MMAVVLAGGRGTRLAPYNTVFPKPLVPLGDRPILDICIHQLVHYGFDRIVISVGYLAELIEAYFRDGSPTVPDAEITFVRETSPLGTVGSLALVPGLTEPFLVMNGDVLTTLDYAALMRHHREHGGLLTIATHRRDVKIDLGVIRLNGQHEVESYEEKPTLSYLVSMGVYVYEPEVLRYIQPGQRLDFPEMVWQVLRDGKKVVAYLSEDYWLDLGSHTDYQRAQDEFETMQSRLLPRA